MADPPGDQQPVEEVGSHSLRVKLDPQLLAGEIKYTLLRGEEKS